MLIDRWGRLGGLGAGDRLYSHEWHGDLTEPNPQLPAPRRATWSGLWWW